MGDSTLLSITPIAASSQNLWTGAAGDGVLQTVGNWSADPATSPVLNVVNSSNGPTALFGAGKIPFLHAVHVGSQGGTGSFNIVAPAGDGVTTNGQYHISGRNGTAGETLALVVGANAGTGTGSFTVTPQSFVDIQGLGVGVNNGGSGVTTGILDIFGAGKSMPHVSTASSSLLGNAVMSNNVDPNTQASSEGLVVGSNGTGTVNVNGAALMSNGTQTFMAQGAHAGALIGDQGGTGTVNALNQGKLVFGAPMAPAPQTYIGRAGGTGAVNVSPDSFMSGKNRVIVGSDGGKGDLTILGKGKVSNAYSQDFCAIPMTPSLVVGGTGIGRVDVSGELDVVGSLMPTGRSGYTLSSIGSAEVGENGVIAVHDAGQLTVGAGNIIQTYDQVAQTQTQGYDFSADGFGPVNLKGGTLYMGSDTGPLPSGVLKASVVNLTTAPSQLVFNHTGATTFTVPTTGSGEIVQQSGVTTLNVLGTAPTFPGMEDPANPGTPYCPTVVPLSTDFSGFNGTLRVTGGEMILPVDNILTAVTSTVIDGGTLTTGTTKQGLGAVTVLGIVNMGNGGQPVDTNTATSWTGSNGTVIMDTTLGADGSPSDVIVVNGPVTGTTVLDIRNAGGGGAQTTNGILVVQTTSQTGQFVLPNGNAPIVVGGFEYRLEQRADGWYLVSKVATVVPPQPQPPTTVTPVPVDSPWMLGALGALLAGFGAAWRRRRPATH